MSDYVISEKEFERAEHDELTDNDIERIRSRPLSEALKQERERLLKRACDKCPLLDERPETCENCLIESMRSEP